MVPALTHLQIQLEFSTPPKSEKKNFPPFKCLNLARKKVRQIVQFLQLCFWTVIDTRIVVLIYLDIVEHKVMGIVVIFVTLGRLQLKRQPTKCHKTLFRILFIISVPHTKNKITQFQLHNLMAWQIFWTKSSRNLHLGITTN